MSVVFISNINLFRLEGLQEVDDTGVAGAYLNSETVAITIKDDDGVEVAGVVWPQTMAYVTSSNGDYAYTAPAAAALEVGRTHYAFIDIDAIDFHCEFPFAPVTRTGVTTTS